MSNFRRRMLHRRQDGNEQGVFIMTKDGTLYSRLEWDPLMNDEAVCAAVITKECKFGVVGASYNNKWCDNEPSLIPNITTTEDHDLAMLDFNGHKNTVSAFEYDPSIGGALQFCRNYTFRNGGKGYLGSAGEVSKVIEYFDEINACLETASLNKINNSVYAKFWCSTQASQTKVWYYNVYDKNFFTNYKYNVCGAFPFLKLK